MNRKQLMRKRKDELLEMLEAHGHTADPKSLKKDLVALLLESERGSGPKRTRAAPPETKATPAKEPPQAGKPETEAVQEAQQRVEETKYSTEVLPEAAPQPEYPTELPKKYGVSRIVAMVRDPYWVFTYWEITPDSIEQARGELGDTDGRHSKVTLRVYDVTGVDFPAEPANSHFDIEVSGGANNWYINTGWPNREYRIDIGLLSPTGEYRTIARSNPAHTPRAAMSEEIDEQWMCLEEEFERMYALSGGFQVGEGSVELREMMERQLEIQRASEAVGSLFSMAIPEKERGFRLAIETELILYGSTEPGAEVTVQGRPVALRPDGTFSLRFALPDGVQVMPVTAVSPDRLEERTITPTVSRTTSTREPVLKG